MVVAQGKAWSGWTNLGMQAVVFKLVLLCSHIKGEFEENGWNRESHGAPPLDIGPYDSEALRRIRAKVTSCDLSYRKCLQTVMCHASTRGCHVPSSVPRSPPPWASCCHYWMVVIAKNDKAIFCLISLHGMFMPTNSVTVVATPAQLRLLPHY